MKRKEAAGKPARGPAPRPRPGGDYADPYKKARRPRAAGAEGSGYARPRRGPEDKAPYARRPETLRRGPGGEGGAAAGERPRREGGGFTVTLDPDVARVFRGDASVNKALRMVMQLLQVVQGPPRGAGPRPGGERRGGYQGSPEARGFTRRPRFDEDEQ
jgi:hypothetical protein